MRKEEKKTHRGLQKNAPLTAEVRELVCLPRRSTDLAFTSVFRPSHVDDIPLGALCVIGHIENASEEERSVLHSLALEARRAYYRSCYATREERFRHALRQLNTYLNSRAGSAFSAKRQHRYHLGVIVVAGELVFVSIIGSVFSYLLRDGKLAPVYRKEAAETATSEAGSFTHFVRGTLLPDDRMFVVTRNFINTDLVEKIDPVFLCPQVLKDLSEQSGAKKPVAPRGEHAAAALIVRFAGEDAEKEHNASVARGPRSSSASDRSSPLLEEILESIVASTQQKEEIVLAETTSSSETRRRRNDRGEQARAVWKHAGRWYTLIPLALAIALGIALPQMRRISRETQTRQETANRIAESVERLHGVPRSATDVQKREMLAEILASFDALSKNSTALPETAHAKKLIADAVKLLDRERAPEAVETLADFSALSVEFSPEALFHDAAGYLITEKSPVQMIRLDSAGGTPRLIITGFAAPESVLAAVKTKELPPRIAFLSSGTIFYLEPRTKNRTEQRIAIPKTADRDAFLVSGARELFLISPRGPIFRAPITKQYTAFSPLLLVKAYRNTGWRAGTVLNSSLFLLTNDLRILQVKNGGVVLDAALKLAEPLGDGVRLKALDATKRLVLLDGERNRIILLDLRGNIEWQYRHELFTDIRDITETENGGLAILTATRLLRFSPAKK